MKNVLATMKLINLINLYFDTGLNVTTDNFLKNLSLAKKLKNKINMIGTVRQKRKVIPEEIKLHKKDELHRSRFSFSA